MAKQNVKLFLIFMHFVTVSGQEPQCNKFSFEEQLLEKMVRLEFKVENMFDSITKSQQEMKNIASKVDKELNILKKERERTKSDFITFKVDAGKRLDDANREMISAISDFEGKMGRLSEDLVTLTNNSLASMNDPFVTYIRWGRTTCPNNSTTMYTGYASGSHNTHKGGPSNTVCLPKDPQHGKHNSGSDGTYIYNAEYQNNAQTQSIFGESMQDQDVPCAVCEVKGKSAILMIPARMECYDGWIKEYSGYLMTEHHTHYRSSMKCVDETPEKILGQSGNTDGDLFYFVEAAGTIPDPPYTRGVELTCVVCTK